MISHYRNDVTYKNFNCKAVEVTEVIEKSIPRNQVVRIIDGDDELKKHSRTSPEIQFKDLH